ncbi:MAG: zinc-ribbon domain-containing protein [Janthinobacterium lividum]
MIVTCPACGKRYRLPDDAIPPEGRTLRCGACHHGWTAVVGDTSLPEAAAPEVAAPEAATVAASPEIGAGVAPRPPVRRRVVAAAAALALAGAAAILLVPRSALPAIELSRLPPLPHVTANLPPLHLPPLALPRIELPPLDLGRIPVVGPTLAGWLDPPTPPRSPLRISVTADHRALHNGTRLLVLGGRVTNPTAQPQPVGPIDAALVDAHGRAAVRWRIAAPVAMLAPGASAPFESLAANYPADAATLRLHFATR